MDWVHEFVDEEEIGDVFEDIEQLGPLRRHKLNADTSRTSGDRDQIICHRVYLEFIESSAYLLFRALKMLKESPFANFNEFTECVEKNFTDDERKLLASRLEAIQTLENEGDSINPDSLYDEEDGGAEDA